MKKSSNKSHNSISNSNCSTRLKYPSLYNHLFKYYTTVSNEVWGTGSNPAVAQRCAQNTYLKCSVLIDKKQRNLSQIISSYPLQ